MLQKTSWIISQITLWNILVYLIKDINNVNIGKFDYILLVHLIFAYICARQIGINLQRVIRLDVGQASLTYLSLAASPFPAEKKQSRKAYKVPYQGGPISPGLYSPPVFLLFYFFTFLFLTLTRNTRNNRNRLSQSLHKTSGSEIKQKFCSYYWS
jgi:hypothetical protein